MVGRFLEEFGRDVSSRPPEEKPVDCKLVNRSLTGKCPGLFPSVTSNLEIQSDETDRRVPK